MFWIRGLRFAGPMKTWRQNSLEMDDIVIYYVFDVKEELQKEILNCAVKHLLLQDMHFANKEPCSNVLVRSC